MVYLPFTVYHRLIDPLLAPVREAMGSLIPRGSTLIDIACGTGEFLLRLPPGCDRLWGIDLNGRSLREAARRPTGGQGPVPVFRKADGRHLPFIPAGEFSHASLSMALHAMPEESRLPVLLEMKRIASCLIIADYAAPLPRNLPGQSIGLIERLAGREHHANFRVYGRRGGLEPLLAGAGLRILEEKNVLDRAIRVVRCAVQKEEIPL